MTWCRCVKKPFQAMRGGGLCCLGKREEVQAAIGLEGCTQQRCHGRHTCKGREGPPHWPPTGLSCATCSPRARLGDKADIWGWGLSATARKVQTATEGKQCAWEPHM